MARGFVSTVSFTLERLKGVGVFKTHGEEVMARSFLFGVQERAEFVDSRAEVGWVTAESDLERLGKIRTFKNLFIPVRSDSGLFVAIERQNSATASMVFVRRDHVTHAVAKDSTEGVPE